jgi:hypothetical protein
VVIGDDQLDAPEAAPGELPEEVGPEEPAPDLIRGLGLRRADVHAEHLPASVGVDADRDDHGDRDDAAILPHPRLRGGRLFT